MGIFNKKSNKVELEKKDVIINELKSFLIEKDKKINQITKEKIQVESDINALIENYNIKLETLKRNKNIEDVEKKYIKEIEELNKSYENKILKIKEDYEIQIHVAKFTKCKELPKQIHLDIEKIIKEKEIGFPWLADALKFYYENIDDIYSSFLERKSHPALKQADRIKKISKERALFKREHIITKYIIKYYESLFPWLKEYIGINSDELLNLLYNEKTEEDNEDPVLHYLTKGEFEKLSITERNQKALDRYWNSRKTPWQIGRDYERYVGYLYEKDGYRVHYFGIEKGLEDLGRDLVCVKNNIVDVVQCKYWSKAKNIPIREKHINQLFGTTVKHYMDFISKDNKINLHSFLKDYYEGKIIGTIFTSTFLSETAKDFAKSLNIKVKQEIELDYKYPSIKCNINQNTKEKIYHLPFDQQYDNVIIDESKGEFYTYTVKEAENNGFRRAWRWKGETD